MTALPVVVSYGGYNAAGRSSFDQAYRRMIFESLSVNDQTKTVDGLAALMGLDGTSQSHTQAVVDGTLIRRIEKSVFDPDHAPWNAKIDASVAGDEPTTFRIRKRQLPQVLPETARVKELDDGMVEVTVQGEHSLFLPDFKPFPVKAAAQLPTGFDPGTYYPSRSQPRGLQMAITGASDALYAMGIDWHKVCSHVGPDEIGMYASSCLGQLADEGFGGVLKSRWLGGRPSSKMIPMSLNSMPADFINAYVLGSVGHTEAITGACASFLYNLQAAVRDIQLGKRRVAFVGCSEAPVTLENLEGFMAMSALATVDSMGRLDGVENPDPRLYSRPFCGNGGFVMGESTQYIVLMDDQLAIDLGADIHGAVPGVFMDADGVKKSISSPGPGNYLTFAKATALGRAILGDSALNNTMVMAHGSSTPQNRVTESLIFDRIAKAFGISNWPVCAVKAYVGHSMATASGDQIVTAIAAMRHGIIPGIKTGKAIADDVYQDCLNIPLKDLEVGTDFLQAAFINAKGFGGNNATGVLLSPAKTQAMLAKRHSHVWTEYQKKREQVREQARAYEERADKADLQVIYRFGEGMMDDEDVMISSSQIAVPGYGKAISLEQANPFADMS